MRRGAGGAVWSVVGSSGCFLLLLRWRHEGLWQTRDRGLWGGECVCGGGAGGGVPGAAGGGGVQRGGGCSFGQLWAVVAVSAAAEVEARGADVGHRAVGW